MQSQRVALVTGGSSGIGAATALALRREGFCVVVLDVMRPHDADLAYIELDLSDVSAARIAVDQIVRDYGRIDILVNNAGLLHSTPVEDITEAEWDRIFDVNMKGLFFLTQSVLVPMKAARYGRIVNVASLAGRMGGYANGVAYSASKAGVIGLTYALARRMAGYGIAVNAVAPGTTRTAILNELPEDAIREIERSIPIGRLGTPEDTAELIVYLASDRASFITGAVIDINGGMFMG